MFELTMCHLQGFIQRLDTTKAFYISEDGHMVDRNTWEFTAYVN